VMIDLQLDVMLRSVVHLTRAVLPQFLEHDRGHVLATVSMGGILALPTSATYSAAKAGLRAFLAAVNAEMYDTGVHVSGIYPSAVDTPMLLREATGEGSPLNFLGAVRSIDDVADAYERALERHRLENYVPYSDSVVTRLLNTFPALTPKLLPFAARIGERGRRRYLATRGN
jgi:short-subunit dehydrogenase